MWSSREEKGEKAGEQPTNLCHVKLPRALGQQTQATLKANYAFKGHSWRRTMPSMLIILVSLCLAMQQGVWITMQSLVNNIILRISRSNSQYSCI